MPVAEVVVITPLLSEMIAADASTSALARAAAAGGARSLRAAALERVCAGETTLQEVDRVVGANAAGATAELAAVPAAAPLPVVSERTRRVDPVIPPFAGLRVLVVDDDPVILLLASTVLGGAGYRVETAGDGLEGLQRLSSGEAFSLLVTDVYMPRLGGAGLLNAVRESSATVSLPVIVLTGRGEGTEEARLMDAGADDYIRKPIDPERFLSRVRATLRRSNLLNR